MPDGTIDGHPFKLVDLELVSGPDSPPARFGNLGAVSIPAKALPAGRTVFGSDGSLGIEVSIEMRRRAPRVFAGNGWRLRLWIGWRRLWFWLRRKGVADA